jgi:two-component system OmpR family sensor kinase
VEVTANQSLSGRLRVDVCDQGPGVPTNELDAIFEPFHRCAGNTAADGFGLGLAIARRAVEAHGGTIRAANRPDGGLCIEIVLSAT